ncbi:uncharacterized protein M6B38_104580 [Iris pallida]|uniref:Uncharacterized protein n=1 Tax=Iris pallida TaxID=29817 RepID=A0AAX6F3V3_IRIPA|nr:uncharacterized protein M6B38_104580 [Iris pallida]
MGTKVQCKNYLPVNYLMSNLNEDSTNSFSLYYEDKSLSGHLYDGCMRSPAKGYLVYDKDIFKQTMMEHEAVFKKQVGELHRLYRKQKDLMHEFKNQELYRSPVQMETSGCYIYSSPMPSETTQKIWQMPHLIPVNTGYNIVHSAGTEEVKPSLNLMQCNELSTETSSSIDGKLMDSKLNNHLKRRLDLQLPADVYINIEDSERTNRGNIPKTPLGATDQLSSIYDLDREREVKLTLGINGDRSCSSSSQKFDPHQQNGRSINSLSGLNRPMKGLACEGEAGLVSNNFIGMRTLQGEIQSNQMPDGSNRGFQPRDFFTENHRDEGALSNFVNAVKEEIVWESPAFNYEEGRSTNGVGFFYPGLSTDEYPLLCGPSAQKLKRSRKTSPGHSEEQSRFGEEPFLAIDTYANSSQLTQPDYSLVPTPQVLSPFSATALSESTSFLRKPIITYTPVAVQALPCFSQEEMMKFRNRNLRKSVTINTESLSYRDGVYHDLCSNPSSAQVKIGRDSIAYEEYEANEPLRYGSIPNATQGKGKHPASLSLQDSSHLLVEMRKKQGNGTRHSLVCEKSLDLPVTDKLQRSAACIPSAKCNGHSGKFVSEITVEDLDSMAAESLVAISLGLGHSSAAAYRESLRWFAEVISSQGARAETSDIDDSSGLDLFESMTLELNEVKPEDHLLQPRERAVLLARTRRGQARRRRRQKKDFRRDILPGLASLSSHQVTEDLHAFDIIMKAGASTARGRGRRRPGGGLAAVITDVDGVFYNPTPVTPLVPTEVVTDVYNVCHNPPLVTPLGLPTAAAVTDANGRVTGLVPSATEVVDRGMMGWGRTTGRGRRPRVRKGKASPSLTINYEL